MAAVEIAVPLQPHVYRAVVRYARADGMSVAMWLHHAAERETQRREYADYGRALLAAGFGGDEDRRRLRLDRAAKKRREREAGLHGPR